MAHSKLPLSLARCHLLVLQPGELSCCAPLSCSGAALNTVAPLQLGGKYGEDIMRQLAIKTVGARSYITTPLAFCKLLYHLRIC